MKKQWFYLTIFLLVAGCQIMEVEQNPTLTGEVEFSNVDKGTGTRFEGDTTSWYIFDMGPIRKGTMARSVHGITSPSSHLSNVVVNTQFDFLDTIWRIMQMAVIGLPAIGSRTIYVEGVEVAPSATGKQAK